MNRVLGRVKAGTNRIFFIISYSYLLIKGKCFNHSLFNIIEKNNLEKIKTIGDSYMCAGGIPVSNESDAVDAILAAIEIQDYFNNLNTKRIPQGLPPWSLRIGIHTGPIVAGVVGHKKFAYDIWGDTVIIANRMESSGEGGKINISDATFAMVKDWFTCFYWGKVLAKNKGEVDMYFVQN